jgi:DNA-binding MarR family transcriptional regulator
VLSDPVRAGSTDEAVELALAITRLKARMRAESIPRAGWTISQLAMLARIIEAGPITASELAQAEHIRPQSVAEIVNTLKAEGLVESRPDPTDGRKSLLSSTRAGRELRVQIATARESWMARAIDAVVGPDERAGLQDAIELLNRLAQVDLQPAHPHGWRA